MLTPHSSFPFISRFRLLGRLYEPTVGRTASPSTTPCRSNAMCTESKRATSHPAMAWLFPFVQGVLGRLVGFGTWTSIDDWHPIVLKTSGSLGQQLWSTAIHIPFIDKDFLFMPSAPHGTYPEEETKKLQVQEWADVRHHPSIYPKTKAAAPHAAPTKPTRGCLSKILCHRRWWVRTVEIISHNFPIVCNSPCHDAIYIH